MNNVRSPFAVMLVLAVVIAGFTGCRPAGQDQLPLSTVSHPEWSKNANIYEVNIRQFTPEGTFKAFLPHLDRLQDMGVDILWFMPIQPIGIVNRKGTLGSYYSIKDYRAINPEFGTMEDFKTVVREVQARGMYVMLDWVANHTAWDHHWATTNPEFYTRDENGNFMAPNADWSDVKDLNYDNPAVWDAMIAEMRFWVEEIGVDGFRCDVAYMVPTEFWERAISELEQVKPLFMLAEAEEPALNLNAFEMSYGWRLHHMMNDIANGRADVIALDQYFFTDNAGNFPRGSYKMYFITNHDENSWAGTEFERLGPAVNAFSALTATVPGMILLYNGQESGFNRRLEFFEKDSVDWNGFRYHGFFQTLLHLKSRNQALWNGLAGGPMERVNTSQDHAVFAFVREKEDDKVFVVLNLSGQTLDFTLQGNLFTGSYTEVFSGEEVTFAANQSLNLEPWGYRIFER